MCDDSFGPAKGTLPLPWGSRREQLVRRPKGKQCVGRRHYRRKRGGVIR